MTYRYLTFGINLQGEKCLVVGGGTVGYRKAMILEDAGADVTVVSPIVSPECKQAIDEGRFSWIASRYADCHLQGVFLVVATTSDLEMNRRIGEDARRRGVLCCVASSVADSQIIFPATWTDGRFVVSVHSHGQSCRDSVRMRDRLACYMESDSHKLDERTANNEFGQDNPAEKSP